MTFTTWKVERTPFISNTWNSADTYEITDFLDPNIVVSLGDNKDNFSITLPNNRNQHSAEFKASDRITIYRKVNSSAITATDIMFVGTIDVPQSSSSDKTDLIRIKGNNASGDILGAIVVSDPETGALPINQAIQGAINSVLAYAPQYPLIWNSSNPTTTSTGVPFPSVKEKFFNKPLKDLLNKYSTKEMTQDGKYVWYVDVNNKIVWKKAVAQNATTFNELTDTHYAFNTSAANSDVVNFLIVKGGTDPEGMAIQAPYYDLSSINANGMKFQILPSTTKTAETLLAADSKKWNVAHPRDATYGSLVTTWKSLVTGTYVTPTSYKTGSTSYIAHMRAHIKLLLKQEGKAYVDTRRFGKVKVSIDMPPSTTWILNDTITVTSPKLDKGSLELRVTEINYTTNSITYTLQEDDGSVGK